MLVGKYTVPTIRLRVLIPQIRGVYQTYGQSEFTRDQLAETMNFKPKSGGFAQKVSDLQNYGLLVKNVPGAFTLTELCQRIFQTADDTKVSDLLYKAFVNVDLWKKLADKYHGNIDKASFIKDLIDLTGLDEVQANKRADGLIQEYMKDWEYIKKPAFDQGRLPQQSEIGRTRKSEHQTIENAYEYRTKEVKKTTPDVRWTLRLTSEVGNIQLDIYDIATYEMALNFLQTIKKQIDQNAGNKLTSDNFQEGSAMET